MCVHTRAAGRRGIAPAVTTDAQTIERFGCLALCGVKQQVRLREVIIQPSKRQRMIRIHAGGLAFAVLLFLAAMPIQAQSVLIHEDTKLSAPDAEDKSRFGTVATDGLRLAVGAWGHENTGA